MARPGAFRLLAIAVAALGVSACSTSESSSESSSMSSSSRASGSPVSTDGASNDPIATEPAPDTTVAAAATTPPATEPLAAGTATTIASTAPPTTDDEVTDDEVTDDETASDADFAELEPIMADFVDANGLNGAGLVVVDRDEGIVHEAYVGEFSADRVSLIASSSKMITAGVLLRLADDGLLDLDAPVADAVDWGAGNPVITPAQLVSNSSGLVGLGPDPAYGPYVCQFLSEREIEECAAEVFETAADDADVIAPDTEFRYGGVQWQVAGALAEAVSGRTWAELIDEIYVEPCGVDSLGYTNHWFEAGGFAYPTDFDPAALTPTDNPHMEGGAYIDPPDYAELLLMHLRGGTCEGGRVLSEQAVERAHTDRVATAYGDAGSTQPGYGLGWWVDRESGIVSDGGAYGSQPWLDLADGYGAYLVVEASTVEGGALYRELEPVVDRIMNDR